MEAYGASQSSGHHGGGLMGRPEWKDFHFRGWFVSSWEAARLLSDIAAGRADRWIGAQNLSLRWSQFGSQK